MVDTIKSRTEFNREFFNWTLVNTGGRVRLRSYQLRIAYPIYRSIVLGDGEEYVISVPRQAGKTTIIECLMHYCANILPSDYSRFSNGVWLGHFGPTREQISSLFRGLKQMFETPFQTKVLGIGVEVSNAQNFELSNKSWIRARTANITAKIEGLTCHGVIIEESQDVPYIRIHKSIYPMCATTGGPKIHIGTMNPENINKAEQEEEDLDYFSMLIAKLPSRNRFVITDTEVLAETNEYWKSEYQKAKDRLGADHPLFKSQWCGQRVEVDNKFIRYDKLISLKRGKLLEKQFDKDCFLGYDTGKLHDSTVLAVYDSTPALINWCEFLPGVDYEMQFTKAVEWLKNFKIVRGVGDYYNAGEAFKDRLVKEGYDVKTLKMNDETRSKIYSDFEIALRQGRFIYPKDDTDTVRRFENQMVALKKRYRGRILVVSKPNRQNAFDDYPDASALGWYAYEEYNHESHIDISSLGGTGSNDNSNMRIVKNTEVE